MFLIELRYNLLKVMAAIIVDGDLYINYLCFNSFYKFHKVEHPNKIILVKICAPNDIKFIDDTYHLYETYLEGCPGIMCDHICESHQIKDFYMWNNTLYLLTLEDDFLIKDMSNNSEPISVLHEHKFRKITGKNNMVLLIDKNGNIWGNEYGKRYFQADQIYLVDKIDIYTFFKLTHDIVFTDIFLYFENNFFSGDDYRLLAIDNNNDIYHGGYIHDSFKSVFSQIAVENSKIIKFDTKGSKFIKYVSNFYLSVLINTENRLFIFDHCENKFQEYENVKDVAVLNASLFVLMNDGTLLGKGSNTYGQLGIDTQNYQQSLIKLTNLVPSKLFNDFEDDKRYRTTKSARGIAK